MADAIHMNIRGDPGDVFQINNRVRVPRMQNINRTPNSFENKRVPALISRATMGG